MKSHSKKRVYNSLFFSAVLFFVLFAAAFFIFTMLFYSVSPALPDHDAYIDQWPTVIIDAGHGGEDGGAIGINGALEKDINLKIAKALNERLRESGIKCVMTREEDVLLYDKNSDYEGRKKALDMQKRLQIASEQENVIFISIHQNSFPVEKYNGFQVYYSSNNPTSHSLALTLENTVREELQPYNDRASKDAGESIYLLKNLSCPAVLIECGFLSNSEECEALCGEEYQSRLSDILSDAVIKFISAQTGS